MPSLLLLAAVAPSALAVSYATSPSANGGAADPSPPVAFTSQPPTKLADSKPKGSTLPVTSLSLSEGSAMQTPARAHGPPAQTATPASARSRVLESDDGGQIVFSTSAGGTFVVRVLAGTSPPTISLRDFVQLVLCIADNKKASDKVGKRVIPKMPHLVFYHDLQTESGLRQSPCVAITSLPQVLETMPAEAHRFRETGDYERFHQELLLLGNRHE